MVESLLLAILGGALGVLLGGAVTIGTARAHRWSVVVPAQAGGAGLAGALVVGAVAGLYPALRAARVAPTDALRSA